MTMHENDTGIVPGVTVEYVLLIPVHPSITLLQTLFAE